MWPCKKLQLKQSTTTLTSHRILQGSHSCPCTKVQAHDHRSGADQVIWQILSLTRAAAIQFSSVARSLDVNVTMHPYQYTTTLYPLRGTYPRIVTFTRNERIGHCFALFPP